MRKIILIVGLIVVIVSVIVYFLLRGSTPDNPAVQYPITLPTASSTNPTHTGNGSETDPASQSTFSIATHEGSAVVNDFLHNGETAADIEHAGSYILAGTAGYCLANGTCPSGATTTDFKITYDSTTSFFNIILLKEPLGAMRAEAEHFLLARLGLNQQDMCVLNYFVGAPYYVSQTYAGKNLGFSFCANATALPH